METGFGGEEKKGRNLAAIWAGNKGRAVYFPDVSKNSSSKAAEDKAVDQSRDEEFSSPKGEAIQAKAVDQMKAVLVLIPVLGVLWLTMQYLPKAGDWIGDQTDRLLGDEETEIAASSESKKETNVEPQTEPVVSVAVDAERPAESKTDYRSQIVEQLGGPERAEVRYLAISDDAKEMVGSLKIIDEAGAESLIEVFFERDKFGRYVSTEDSPVATKLTLWTE